MRALLPLSFCAFVLPNMGAALPIAYDAEATVTKTREVGAATTEDMRIYTTDGTHINAIITRTPITVTYTVTTDIGLQPGDMDMLRGDAVHCDQGRVEDASEGTVGDLIVFRFECVLP
jgi:hypothetical protein